jgi:putative chitinase
MSVVRAIRAMGWRNLTAEQAAAHADALIAAMAEFEIDTPARQAAFLAQLAHETGGFRWLRELGSVRYLQRYEGRADLGNTEPGDGPRFRGRGYIQLTGRHNYQQAGAALNLPLLAQPELAEQPEYAARIAGWYWYRRALNLLADRGDFRRLTRAINGGLNGIADRESKWAIAKQWLEGRVHDQSWTARH